MHPQARKGGAGCQQTSVRAHEFDAPPCAAFQVDIGGRRRPVVEAANAHSLRNGPRRFARRGGRACSYVPGPDIAGESCTELMHVTSSVSAALVEAQKLPRSDWLVDLRLQAVLRANLGIGPEADLEVSICPSPKVLPQVNGDSLVCGVEAALTNKSGSHRLSRNRPL